MSRRWLQQIYPTTGQPFAYSIKGTGEFCAVLWNEMPLEFEVRTRGHTEGWCRWEDQIFAFALGWTKDHLQVWLDGSLFLFRETSPSRQSEIETIAATGNLVSPIPGKVLRLLVHVGAQVEAEHPMVVIESMKMEHLIRAPRPGVVREVLVEEGNVVERGTPLIDLQALSDD